MKNGELTEKEIFKLHKQFAHCHTDKLGHCYHKRVTMFMEEN